VLARYKRIRRLEFTDLLKTISGKIRRVQLRTSEAEQWHKERKETFAKKTFLNCNKSADLIHQRGGLELPLQGFQVVSGAFNQVHSIQCALAGNAIAMVYDESSDRVSNLKGIQSRL